ncbi:MAG: MFS transporter [Thermomicrobiales bacterium]
MPAPVTNSRDQQSVRRAIALLCAVIFLADVVFGIVAPTFSLFAKDLGIAVALLGTINTLGSFTQLLIALPLGLVSDRLSRPRVITAGMVIYAAALASFAVAQGPVLLIVGRVFTAFAAVAIFQIGSAHLGDITVTGQREVAYGWLTTAMGLGFTAGPLIGSQLAERYGPRSAYVAGSLIALAGGLIAGRFLREPGGSRHAVPRAGSLVSGMRHILRQRDILVVSFGNLLMGIAFSGAISTFFPIYGDHVMISEGTIGTMFAIRALVSAASRFPNSMLARHVGGKPILLIALFLEVVVMFGIAMTGQRVLLTALLAAEGLAFGAYLVAGQTFIAEHTTRETRGAAVGVYSTASNLGGTAAPILLGLIAGRWGIASVFTVTASVLCIGFVVCAAGMLFVHRSNETLRVVQQPASD